MVQYKHCLVASREQCHVSLLLLVFTIVHCCCLYPGLQLIQTSVRLVDVKCDLTGDHRALVTQLLESEQSCYAGDVS